MKEVKVILTSKNTMDRLTEKESISFKDKANVKADIQLDASKSYQSIIGFGGAFTEAAAYTLSKMSEDKRQEVINSYFDKEKGLGYSIGRVHIHSCDFALGNYTYVEEYDTDLKSFDISRDMKWVIPLIKNSMSVRGEKIKLLASPWSPPAWMKTNKDMNHGGKLLPEYREAWARYYTKFINEYKNQGVDIWGITVQNEPEAVQRWDSCIYTEEEEREFVRDYLGPIMHKQGLQDVKILIWDHNRDVIVRRAAGVLSDPEAAKYVWGTAFHWYCSTDFENVGKVHDMFPDKHLLFTEGCQEFGVHIGDWTTGERYAINMIGDLNNWTEGYIDWNIVLDEEGGPNHVRNLCDAPIIADTRTNELYYNSSYYYIGHFSKYIKPGAIRIGVESLSDKLKVTSFLNENGTIATIVLNETNEAVNYTLGYEDSLLELSLEPHSIATYLCEK